MKTYMANPDKIERKWYVVDAEGCTLGRLSSEIAKVLRGKNKPEYTPHVDTGDYVIVVNADKVKVTGKKLQQKIYYNHSDYVGGMRETTLAEMLAKKPEKVVELAVKGMLPKGPLGRAMIKKLHVYAGAEHNNLALMICAAVLFIGVGVVYAGAAISSVWKMSRGGEKSQEDDLQIVEKEDSMETSQETRREIPDIQFKQEMPEKEEAKEEKEAPIDTEEQSDSE